MADLHEALKNLSPVEWSDVPQDDLQSYLNNAFTAGELIINTVPPLQHGTPFKDSKPHMHMPNSAKSHKEMHPSAARSQPPHPEHEALQKIWGKSMKFNEKDNPLHVAIYKTAGHDRHGSWFARRSVHEGLGFDKMKKAMMREFATSMAVVGGPGAGAIRGLAADKRLENIDIKDTGRLEVYHLSAQFPGPVTARDFVTLLMTSDDVLTDKSAANLQDGEKHVPRHFMIVSRPVDHPDAPERNGYVRAQYESVEMIREIPLSAAKSQSTPNLLSQTTEAPKQRERGVTVAAPEQANGNDLEVKHTNKDGQEEMASERELNPVEWIMVTRSDPGGGIPRFLVDRGTPETMIGDIHKFFNWACSQGHMSDADNDVAIQQDVADVAPKKQNDDAKPYPSVPNEDKIDDISGPKRSITAPATTAVDNQNSGIGSIITQALQSGIESYAPASVAALVHDRFYSQDAQVPLSDDSSDVSSIASFLSASEMQRPTSVANGANLSTDDISIASAASDTSVTGDKKKSNHHDRELQKLIQKREKLDRELAKKREAEESKVRQSQEKSESEASKQKEKIEKDLRAAEEKHRKEVEKIEKKKAKEARKAEERRAKKDDRIKLSMITRERDEFRSRVDLYRRENALLREQVADLQATTTAMTAKLGKMGGNEALRSVQEEIGRARASSALSTGSRTSAESVAKSLDRKIET